jgi:hypothetical protein
VAVIASEVLDLDVSGVGAAEATKEPGQSAAALDYTR